jgi:hypothetical protein
VALASYIFAAQLIFAAGPPNKSYSKPNASGGFDFFNASGEKIGSSSRRPDGGYDYYDKHGNWTGRLVPANTAGVYHYYDHENVYRGKVSTEPYGGYRYSEQQEGVIDRDSMDVRRDHEYKDEYGSGLETLSPETIQGKKK